MRKTLYNAINKLGYSINNRKKRNEEIKNKLSTYNIVRYIDLALMSSYYIFLLEDNFEDFNMMETENGLRLSFNKLCFNVESKEEFHILKEIFVNKDYNFLLDQKCIVIDIGANVGFSSLFFSQLENVQKIYAFEPVKDTYDLALLNFKQNSINKVAEFNNFGLGNRERKENFLFNRQAKGNSGLRGTLSPGYKNNKKAELRTVIIKKASEIIKLILSNNKEYKVVLKMDCEGAEYEIMEDLQENNLLEKIDIIMVEWHDHGALNLEKQLVNNNFTIFSRNLGSLTGMISALRNH